MGEVCRCQSNARSRSCVSKDIEDECKLKMTTPVDQCFPNHADSFRDLSILSLNVTPRMPTIAQLTPMTCVLAQRIVVISVWDRSRTGVVAS